MRIRDERPEDRDAVHALNVAAFGTRLEADLIDTLRTQAAGAVSLVCEENGAIVGHILFTPVTLLSDPLLRIMGLGPMAVAPASQRQGIGSRLILDGLEQCRRNGAVAVVVVGHAAYYPRFGFVPGAALGIRCEYDVPDDVFLVRELRDGALTDRSGTVRYHPAFADV